MSSKIALLLLATIFCCALQQTFAASSSLNVERRQNRINSRQTQDVAKLNGAEQREEKNALDREDEDDDEDDAELTADRFGALLRDENDDNVDQSNDDDADENGERARRRRGRGGRRGRRGSRRGGRRGKGKRRGKGARPGLRKIVKTKKNRG